MSLHIELGRILLAHVDLPCRVAVSATVTFQPPSLNSTEPSSKLLERLLSLSTWACRGSGLCLVIRLLFNGQPWEIGRHETEMLLDLKKALRGAELWNQLKLATTILDNNLHENHHELDQNSIVIGLRHMVTDETGVKTVRHRLAIGAAAADVKAPHGVEVVGLKKVTIVLDFRREPGPTPSPKAGAGSSHNEPLTGSDARADCFGSTSEDEEFLLEEELWFEEILTFPTQGTKHILDTTEEQCVTSSYLGSEHLVELVDAALRLFICTKPSSLAPGIWMPHDRRTATLGNVVPAIWSPGYLQAVSQRACLLPTVDHALSSLSSVNVQSTSLKLKLQQLATGQSTNLPQSTRIDTLLPKLWTIIQQGVHQKNAANVLKAMKPTSNPEEEQEGLDTEMLEYDNSWRRLSFGGLHGSERDLRNLTTVVRSDDDQAIYEVECACESASILETPGVAEDESILFRDDMRHSELSSNFSELGEEDYDWDDSDDILERDMDLETCSDYSEMLFQSRQDEGGMLYTRNDESRTVSEASRGVPMEWLASRAMLRSDTRSQEYAELDSIISMDSAHDEDMLEI